MHRNNKTQKLRQFRYRTKFYQHNCCQGCERLEEVLTGDGTGRDSAGRPNTKVHSVQRTPIPKIFYCVNTRIKLGFERLKPRLCIKRLKRSWGSLKLPQFDRKVQLQQGGDDDSTPQAYVNTSVDHHLHEAAALRACACVCAPVARRAAVWSGVGRRTYPSSATTMTHAQSKYRKLDAQCAMASSLPSSESTLSLLGRRSASESRLAWLWLGPLPLPPSTGGLAWLSGKNLDMRPA